MRKSGYVIAALWMLSLNAVPDKMVAQKRLKQQKSQQLFMAITQSDSQKNLHSPKRVSPLSCSPNLSKLQPDSPENLLTEDQLDELGGEKMNNQSRIFLSKLLNASLYNGTLEEEDILSEE